MKVKCIRLLDATGKAVDYSPWMKLGSDYDVLTILVEPTRTLFRILGEQWPPALFQPEMFEVVNSRISPLWIVTSARPGVLSFSPEAWSRAGFWDDVLDGEPDALACFEEERRKLQGSGPEEIASS